MICLLQNAHWTLDLDQFKEISATFPTIVQLKLDIGFLEMCICLFAVRHFLKVECLVVNNHDLQRKV